MTGSNLTQTTLELHSAGRLEEASAQLANMWLLRIGRWRHSAGEFFDIDAAVPAATTLIREFAPFLHDADTHRLRDNQRLADAVRALLEAMTGADLSPPALMRDMDELAQVLDGACLEWVGEYDGGNPPADAVVRVAGRLNRAPIIVGEIGVDFYTSGVNATVTPQVRQFADMISHELATPLNAAVVTAQLLEYTDGALRTPEARQLVTLIRRNLARADSVIRDVRSAVLTNNAGSGAAMRPFGQVLAEALAEIHEEVVLEGIRLDVDEPIANVNVDAARVKLILVNLIRNAIRYSDPTRSLRWIRISCNREATHDRWWVCVSDNGLGIPAEHHGSIFRRHFRGHPQRSAGTGLGLTIVHDEVQRMGAEIDFTSTEGVGTVFRFTLPTACTQSDAAPDSR